MTANHRPLEEGDIELIDRIRATPCLYDTKDPDFRLVYKKEQQWQTIAEGLSMSHWEARKRWTVLRDRYARELKQLLLHPDSMEYGKNEFFHRMDFLRNFVKKRSVRKKCYSSHGEEIIDEKSVRPIKIFKVDCNINSFDSSVSDNHEEPLRQHEQLSQQHHKSYVVDDSQDSLAEKFSYMEQSSQEVNEQGREHDTVSHIEHCEEHEYHDYVEETSAAYETVEEDHETNSHDVSNHSLVTAAGITDKPEANKVNENFCISIIENNKSQHLPQLQHRPVIQTITNTCSHTTMPTQQDDSEEYFSKTIALYLKQLSRRYKIKAKVEMMQILEKYIELEEMRDNSNK